MSATNSRIAKLNRAKVQILGDYASKKANWTPAERKHFDTALTAIDRLITAEKLRRVA
jgi:hypothetical protein